MPTRTLALACAVGAAALALTGITYAATAGSTQTEPSARRAVPSVQRAARPVHRAAAPAAAAPSRPSAGEKGVEGRDHEGRDHGRERREEGRIHFNDRTFSAATDGCVIVASGLGSDSFSIFNDSEKTVEVFRGFTCDNGAPVATVGPHGATHGVVTRTVHQDLFGDDGVVGSFEVIGHYDE